MKLLIIILIGYLAYRSFRSCLLKNTMQQQNAMQGEAGGEIEDDMVKDPYCDVYITRRDGVHLRHAGEDLYFCSEECRDKYLER